MPTSVLRQMPRPFLLVLLIFMANGSLLAQIAVGQWREHLPYHEGVEVAVAGDWVYMASQSGLFQYHRYEGDVNRLSKVNGLSDIGYSTLAWSDANNTLVVAYTNTNIDLIQDGQIINIPDIKDKSILGLKTINKIQVQDDLAYLACGFGVVVLDLVRHEIKDTYYIGPNGSSLNIQDVALSETDIYACTEDGVYTAPLVGSNLADFESWSQFNTLPNGSYNAGTWFANRLYVNLADEMGNDSIFFYENGQWTYFDVLEEQVNRRLETAMGRLLVCSGGITNEYDAQHTRYRFVFDYGSGLWAAPRHATVDTDGTLWIADGSHGLIRVKVNQTVDQITVNGPSGSTSTDISVWDGRCYVASGGITSTWSNKYNRNGLYHFENNSWENIKVSGSSETSGLSDYLKVLVNPFDSRQVYVAAYGYGVVAYYDGEFVEMYDTSNSSLQSLPGLPGNIRVAGLAMDRNSGVLWVAAGQTDKQLHAKDLQGNWYGFNIPGLGGRAIEDIAIDDIGQKWVVVPRGHGLVVYNDNGTLESTNDDRSIILSTANGNGELASNTIFSIARDLDGEIWVGTDNGISVFYSPESVFADGQDFDAARILVTQDGYVQELLENEAVTAIAVDGANRKWLGTGSAGVFLMSEDGSEEILHLTTDNSPLLSDQITAIGIDHLSGEVFIGTDKGLISYKGTATWGTPEFLPEDVYAYPNPVEPDYHGPVAIKGLVRDADVKITDAAGNVVFATIAEGGQAIWDGNRQTGGRAKSGVYMVFASNEDGKETMVTKILFIN